MVTTHHFQPQNMVFQPKNTQPQNFSGQPQNINFIALRAIHFVFGLIKFYGMPMMRFSVSDRATDMAVMGQQFGRCHI